MRARAEVASMGRTAVLDLTALREGLGPLRPALVRAALLGRKRVPAASPPMGGRGTITNGRES